MKMQQSPRFYVRTQKIGGRVNILGEGPEKTFNQRVDCSIPSGLTNFSIISNRLSVAAEPDGAGEEGGGHDQAGP